MNVAFYTGIYISYTDQSTVNLFVEYYFIKESMTSIIHSSGGGSGCDQSTSTKGNFVAEIQSMMHGFGDARTPLLESATLIETVVQQQQWALINQAADVSIMRGAKSIGPEDILFLLRKDPVKTHRLLKYLAVKDLKKNISGVLQDSSVDWDPTLETSCASGTKQSHVCMDFLQSIDQTGELTDTSAIPLDVVKYERNVRAERSSRMLDDAKYMEFANARRASFTSLKSVSKFREWLRGRSDGNSEAPKISNITYDLLGYMAYETVAQIVDLALLVRQDNLACPGSPFSRYMPATGYSTRYSLDCRQIEAANPLTPAEIREALRRYWSSPIGPTASFTRNTVSHLHPCLLSC